jgi:diguanylate cyclase (GGDEF)-like protein
MVDILHEVASSLKPDEIFQVLVRRVAQGLKISRCSIILAEPGDPRGTVVAAYENPTLRSLEIDLQRYPEIRHALDTGELVLAQDVSTDPIYEEIRSEWQSEGRPIPCRSAIAMRFALKGRPAGVFFLRTTEDDVPLNQQDVQFADQVITAAVQSLERAYDLERAVSGQEQLRHLASTDPLTGTLNRRALAEKLEQEMDRAARYASLLTCMMIDIDNFKQINDTHGHLVGDRILKQLAALLKREQRSPDAVARYGGEEFVVLLPDTPVEEGQLILTRLQRSLSGGLFMHEQKQIFVTFSAGVTAYRLGERIEDALERADQALYEAKRTGKNRTCVG